MSYAAARARMATKAENARFQRGEEVARRKLAHGATPDEVFAEGLRRTDDEWEDGPEFGWGMMVRANAERQEVAS